MGVKFIYSPRVTCSATRESAARDVSLQPVKRKPKKSVVDKMARRSAESKVSMADLERLAKVEEQLAMSRREAKS